MPSVQVNFNEDEWSALEAICRDRFMSKREVLRWLVRSATAGDVDASGRLLIHVLGTPDTGASADKATSSSSSSPLPLGQPPSPPRDGGGATTGGTSSPTSTRTSETGSGRDVTPRLKP